MRGTVSRGMSLCFALAVLLCAIDAYSQQAVDTATGVQRPVTAQEIDRLRQTIDDETRSSLEGIVRVHTETGDLNNRLNFYRLGARVNLRRNPGTLLYLTGLRTGYSTTEQVLETAGTNLTFGLRTQIAEGVTGQFEAGGTRFSTGGTTLNALGSIGLSSPSSTLTFTASRMNVEESLLSATGVRPVAGPFAGLTVGQVMDNRFTADGTYQLTSRLDAFGNGGFGFRKGVNVASNFFKLAGGGAGYNVISAPPEERLSLVRAGYEASYIGFNDNRLGFGGASLTDSRGRPIDPSRIGSDGMSPESGPASAGVGGYFSPENFFSHVIRGEIRGHPAAFLEYQLSGFVGSQYYTGSPRRQAAGFSGTVSVRLSDRYSVPITMVVDNYGPFRQQSLFARLIVRF